MPGVRNTIRVMFGKLAGGRKRPNSELHFLVSEVLATFGCIQQREIFCIQEFGMGTIFDVTFFELGVCVDFFEKVKRNLGLPVLEGITFQPSFMEVERPLTIHLYDPFTDMRLIWSFLHRYCASVRGGEQKRNVFGIFNGNIVFWVRLRADPRSPDGLVHPPASFSLGGFKGYLHYPGMPESCRQCGKIGHKKEECPTGQVCRNCGEPGHWAGSCTQAKKCDLCRQVGHTARQCPNAYTPDGVTAQDIQNCAREYNATLMRAQEVEADATAAGTEEEAAVRVVQQQEVEAGDVGLLASSDCKGPSETVEEMVVPEAEGGDTTLLLSTIIEEAPSPVCFPEGSNLIEEFSSSEEREAKQSEAESMESVPDRGRQRRSPGSQKRRKKKARMDNLEAMTTEEALDLAERDSSSCSGKSLSEEQPADPFCVGGVENPAVAGPGYMGFENG